MAPSSSGKARYVAGLFGRIARRYDLLNTAMTGGRHAAWRRLAARVATEGLEGDALDVATGTGDLALALAHRPGVRRVVGLDLAPLMVALARRKVQRHPSSARVEFSLGDALALPFPDDRFICATSGFALRNVEDPGRSIKEMARVVRPGGKVVVLEIVPFEGAWPLRALFRLYFRGMVPLLGTLLAGDREAYTYLPRSVENFYTWRGLLQLMAQQGLTSVGCRPLALGSVLLLWGTKAA